MRRIDSWRCQGGDTRRCHYTDLSLSFPLYQRWSLQLLGSVDAQPVSDGNDIYVCSLAACHRLEIYTVFRHLRHDFTRDDLPVTAEDQ